MRRLILSTLVLMLVSLTANAQNTSDLYTSASGWVKWGNIPTTYTAEGGITYDFEEEVATGALGEGWSTIDADHEGLAPGVYADWTIPTNAWATGHNGTAGVIYSESYYCNGSTWSQYGFDLNPDNWLITPQTTITQQNKIFSFWAAATDATHCAEHFGVFVSTNGNTNTAFFEMKDEWTCTDAEWNRYTVDLSSYVGQQIYVAIRHFNCTNQFRLRVDDICFGGMENYELQSVNLLVDGNIVAQNVDGHDYLFDAESFADGSNHTTTLQMVYGGNNTINESYEWTYKTGNHFTGSPVGLQLTFNGTRANLSWSLPEMETLTGDLFYDFEDGSLGDLNKIDADGDGHNWHISGEGQGLNSMFSAISDTYTVGDELDPDDYLFTRKLIPSNNTMISFDAAAWSNYYDDEVYGVAVSTDGVNFTTIQTWTIYDWEDEDKFGTIKHTECSLSAYAEQEIYVAIRHYNSGINDAWSLMVDNILINNVQRKPLAKGALVYRNDELIAILDQYQTTYVDYPNRDVLPEYCIRIIQDGTRESGWHYALAEKQCAEAELTCYPPYDLQGSIDETSNDITITWMPSITPIEIMGDTVDGYYDGWERIDADGDGQGWLVWNYGGMNENGSIDILGNNICFVSSSYLNSADTPLDPDNYLIMPKITVGNDAQLVFYAAGYHASYPNEHFGVAVSTTNNTSASAFTMLADWVTEHEYTQYTVDLSSYSGQDIYIAFRHYESPDQYCIVLDNIYLVDAVYVGGSLDGQTVYHIERSTDGINYVEIATTNSTSYVDEDLADGTYWYRVYATNTLMDGSVCDSDFAWDVEHNKQYIVFGEYSINEDTDCNVQIYPNPTKGQLNIEANGMSRIAVINTLGQTVYEANVNNDSYIIDMNRFGAGMYMLSITTDNGVVVKRVNVVK